MLVKMTTREVDVSTKPESRNGDVVGKINSSTSSSTSSWSRLKDPRIVRVSRAFGGKDRHSKVSTVRGLRDRRVRLSVPTAIQLYDLQDRLGLNQPSKVVDWLLNAAKHEIDELPPLQIPPGSFTFNQNLHPAMNSNDFRLPSDQGKEALNLKQSRMDLWRSDKPSKDVGAQETTTLSRTEDDGMNLLNNINAMPPYSSFLRWDPSNLSLSNSRRSGLTTPQTEDFQNFNLVPLPSSAVSHVPIIPSGSSHQVLVYHQPRMTQSYFPSPVDEFDPKQVLNFQMLNPNSQLSSNSLNSSEPVRPFHFSMTNNGEREPGKHEEFHDPV